MFRSKFKLRKREPYLAWKLYADFPVKEEMA